MCDPGAINISLLTELNKMSQYSIWDITFRATLCFPSSCLCGKSLRHETTTIVVLSACFISRSFLLLIRNS